MGQCRLLNKLSVLVSTPSWFITQCLSPVLALQYVFLLFTQTTSPVEHSCLLSDPVSLISHHRCSPTLLQSAYRAIILFLQTLQLLRRQLLLLQHPKPRKLDPRSGRLKLLLPLYALLSSPTAHLFCSSETCTDPRRRFEIEKSP